MEPEEDPATGDAESGTRVQVVVRVRPVLPTESVSDAAVTCSSDGTKVQVLLPDKTGNGKEMLPGASRSGARAYEFDACLPGSTNQTELFEVCGLQELVESALDGYSVTVFAFGQTGSGKTHTMIGPRLSRTGAMASLGSKQGHVSLVEPEDGVLPRCLAAAYAGIEHRSDTADFTVSASCVELYNEAVTDLLGEDKAKQLAVRKDERGSFRVDGLSQLTCKTAGAALKAMARALQYRHTRAHALNDYSSRSHCLMTFVFASKEKQAADGQGGSAGGIRRYGKLVLVDLAGSERLRETGNTAREAVRETGAINKSLFTLGQVLASLAARSSRGEGSFGAAPVHVPFRDSKLTQLLWDGLRGSGRALMLACLGPMKQHAEESLNTLHFASVALRIKAQPVVLLDPQDQLVLELRGTIRQLQEENRALAAAMAQLSSGADASVVFGTLPEKLRLAAARDAMGSAPAPSAQAAPVPTGESQQLWPPPRDGRASVPAPPQTAPAPKPAGLGASPGLGGGSRASHQPWQSAADPATPSGLPQADVLQVGHSPASPATPSGLGLIPTPINYNYSFSSAPRTGGSSKKPPPSSSSRMGFASASTSFTTAGAGAGRRSASVDASVRRSTAASAYGSPSVLARANSGNLFADTPVNRSAGSRPNLARTSQPQPQRAAAPPPLKPPSVPVHDFPELAALEAQFMQQIGVSAPAKASAGSGAAGDESRQRDQDERGAAAGSWGAAGPAGSSGQQDPNAPVPEPKALSWAEKNMWFGADTAMTEFAYVVHDDLVGRQGYDAASDAYYQAIEARVAQRFPDKWRKWKGGQRPGASPPSRPLASGPSFGAGLKVNLKDPTPAGLGAGLSPPTGAPAGPVGPYSPQRSFSNNNPGKSSKPAKAKSPKPPAAAWGSAGPTSPSPKQGSAARDRLRSAGESNSSGSGSNTHAPPSAESGREPLQLPRSSPAGPGASPSNPARKPPLGENRMSVDVKHAAVGSPAVARRASGLSSHNSPPTLSTPASASTPLSTSINPFGLSSPSVYPSGYSTPVGGAPQPAPRFSPATTVTGAAWSTSAYGSPAAGRSMLARLDPFAGYAANEVGYREMQAEYGRQRQAVLEELRRAKEDAEAERRQILAKIGRTLGASRWRT